MEQQVRDLVQALGQLQGTVQQQSGELQQARRDAAVAQATSAATAASRSNLVDTRLLGKPRTFDGSDSSWSNFSTIFRAYMGAISPELLTGMQQAEVETTPILQTALADDTARGRSTQLYFVLVMLLEGRAQDKVPRVPHGAGLELWRLRSQEYEG